MNDEPIEHNRLYCLSKSREYILLRIDLASVAIYTHSHKALRRIQNEQFIIIIKLNPFKFYATLNLNNENLNNQF